MPTYNKQCKDCAHKFEEIKSYEEDHTKSRCPHCHSRNVKNLVVTAPAVLYNGDGFTKAVTDKE